ncbi:hypothetical protein EB796_011361 [Bugula neritina]|uniref:Uncharacterized protein n=1 Tax=Bugula neritina TaxID=10212 RepID=A0A7J7JYF9_BUGNE|nr:hypothetical protein EB796_011361 [Bugula neritina]
MTDQFNMVKCNITCEMEKLEKQSGSCGYLLFLEQQSDLHPSHAQSSLHLHSSPQHGGTTLGFRKQN